MPIQKQAPRGKWNFRIKAVYLVAVLDFVLFNEFETDKEDVIEYVRLMRESTKTLYSKKLNFVFVELPKFRKTEKELVTNADKWLFVLKNLSQLKERPRSLQGKVFEMLFQLAEVEELTKEDMREYRKSILKYQDVRDAVDLARDEGRDEGREESITFIVQKCLQKKMSVNDIIDLTGISKERIMKIS